CGPRCATSSGPTSSTSRRKTTTRPRAAFCPTTSSPRSGRASPSSRLMRTHSCMLAFSLLLASGVALAQAPSDGPSLDPSALGEGEDGATGEPRAPVAAAAEEGASPGSVLPADDESVYVVQRRAYSKSGRLELSALPFSSLNNKFVGYFGLGLSAAY